MKFCIQVSDPRSMVVPGKHVNDLSEAIETIFPLHAEAAFVEWNDIYIPLSYKYDISVIIDNIVSMADELLSSQAGTTEDGFSSNTFNADLQLTWADGMLVVSALWHAVDGNIDVVASECASLEVSVEDFLSEWKGIFAKIRSAIQLSQITMEDTEVYERLKRVESSIATLGKLYR